MSKHDYYNNGQSESHFALKIYRINRTNQLQKTDSYILYNYSEYYVPSFVLIRSVFQLELLTKFYFIEGDCNVSRIFSCVNTVFTTYIDIRCMGVNSEVQHEVKNR